MSSLPDMEPGLAVLHLDDSAQDAEILLDRLARDGLNLRLDRAANEREFEDFLRHGEYDVILADYQLPGFDAPAALKRVSALRPGTPFICVSGAIGEDLAADLVKQGAADYVRKDRLDRLPMAMRRAIAETKQRQARFAAEAGSRNSEQVYASVVEDLPHSVFRKDTEGRFTFANQRFCEIVGLPRQELLGKPDAELFPPELALKYQGDDRQVMRSGSMLNTVEEHQLPNGAKLHVQVIKYPFRDDAGNVAGVQGVLWDITERKRMEEALRESEQLYRSLFENMLNGFAYCRMLFEDGKPRDFIYIAVNDAFESLTGLKHVVGKKVTEVIPALRETDPELFELFGQVAMTGQSQRSERFVEALARKFKVPFFRGTGNVKRETKKTKTSIEEAARQMRYDFFLWTARSKKIPVIALAHTMDDQAETVLMRILQGTGLRGLQGIREKFRRGRTALVRPLLGFTKKEILEFLRAAKFTYRKDKSNDSMKFLRNRIRRNLIPMLQREFNPRVTEALSRIPSIVAGENALIVELEEKAWEKAFKKSHGSKVELRRSVFLKFPPALQFRLVEKALKKLDKQSGLSFEAWERIRRGLARPSFCSSLPKDIDFALTSKSVTIYKK